MTEQNIQPDPATPESSVPLGPAEPIPAVNAACWFLTGPTASGKSTTAVALAQKIDAEIISLDSMTIYREMDIGTMQRSVTERRREQQRAYDRLDSTVARYFALHAGQLPDELEQSADYLVDTTGNMATVDAPFDLDREAQQAAEEVRKQWRLIDNRETRINEFEVEIHKKFSIPAACLVFVLVGAPLGALIRRRGAAVSVGVSLFFFWIYWMFLIGGEELADRGYIAPTLAMWAPNIVLAVVGWGLLRLVNYDRAKSKT